MTATTQRPLRGPSPVARWMTTKSPAERRTAVLLLGVVAVAALWATLWVPLTRDTASLRLARAVNVAALADARDRAKEASELSRTGAVAPAVDARAELDRVLAQQGVRPAVTSLDWRDGRAQVVFAAIGYDRLIALLEMLQHSARLRAVDATITARVEPGMVRAELTLAR
jgi:type II secretory pathway component PulM